MLLQRTVELQTYQPAMFDSMVQAFVEATLLDPYGISLSYAEARALLSADIAKPGFDARLFFAGHDVVGFISWYRIASWQLAGYILTRFHGEWTDALQGDGAFISKYSVIPTRRDSGLARALASAAAEAMDNHFAWAVLSVPYSMQSKATTYGFTDTGLRGIYDPELSLMQRG